eukprot:1927376-Prorocentrum_lima.AAC.1
MSIVQHQLKARKQQIGNGSLRESRGNFVADSITPSLIVGLLVGFGCGVLFVSWTRIVPPTADKAT